MEKQAANQGMKEASGNWKKSGKLFSPEPLEGMQPSLNLDFSPGRSIWNFWPPELYNNKFVFFTPLQYLLEGLMPKLKFQYFGHLMWRTDSLEKTLMLGKIEDEGSGWQRMRRLDDTTDSMDMSLSKLRELVVVREAWRAAVQSSSVQFSSVTQSCPTLCNPMNHSTPGLPVHHQLLEFTQTHVHWVSDAMQPSHPLSSPSPPAPNTSQHQSLKLSPINKAHSCKF